MYSVIITFYLSLLGIIAMLFLKRHELQSGRATVVSRLGRGSDEMFHQMSCTFRHAISYINKKTFIVMTQWIAFHILLRVRKVYVEIKQKALDNPHSHKVINAVRGRGEVHHHGASFYLRRISEKPR